MSKRGLVIVPSRGTATIEWSFALRNLELPEGADVGYIYGYSVDHERNQAVTTALKGGYDWLFFLDDDVIAPPGTFARLNSHHLDIVSGLYWKRWEPIEPAMRWDEPKERKFKMGDLVEVDYAGAGCLLIQRSVLEKIEYPWFEWATSRPDLPQDERDSDDYFFCRKARKAGFKIHVDTGVRCLHVGYGRAGLGGSFVPLRKVSEGADFEVGQAASQTVGGPR